MERVAAQGSVIHDDDTYVGILSFMGERRAKLLQAGELPDPDRTGMFTTAIVSNTEQGTVALFYSGRKHAGENLNKLLTARDPERAAPILMSDALSRNVPKDHVVVEANCTAHARRPLSSSSRTSPPSVRRCCCSCEWSTPWKPTAKRASSRPTSAVSVEARLTSRRFT